MPLSAFADIIVRRLPGEQVYAILQAITSEIADGACPVCGEDEIPVDEHGNAIEGYDVSHAEEWREMHDVDCIIALIEEARAGRKVSNT